MLLGGGLQQLDYAYNERGWLQSINNGVSSGVAPNDLFGQSLYYYSHPSGYAGWSPQYNGNLFGQKTSTQGQEFTYAYRYDDSDRLKDVYLSGAPMEDYSFDANGNITKRHYWTPSKSEITKDYRYIGGTNKLMIADRAHSLLDDTLFYDANGNVTRSSARKATMSYDPFNQLTMVVVKTDLGADTIRYSYNANGDRIRKEYRYHYRTWCDQHTKSDPKDDEGKGGDSLSLWCILSDVKNTYYVLGRGQVLAEQSSPSPTSAKAKFIYAGSNRIGMRDESNRLHYYLNDHLGSTRLVIDSTGAASDLLHYYAFGSTLFEQTSTNQAYRYTGKPLDKEAGLNLYYYGARYYDPELGRFLAIDPAAGSYPSLSPYSYCADNPLRNVDPDGRFADYALDVASIGLSAADMWNDPSWSNAGWLALDVVTGVAPFVPAVGVIRHAGKVADVVGAVISADNAADVAKDVKLLTDIATDAEKAVGGVGGVAGTAKHSRLTTAVKKADDAGLKAEQSYKDGKSVRYGTKGSKRPDVVRVDESGKPTAVYDLKTGSAKLTPKRIAELRQAVGDPKIPVIPIRPQPIE